MSSKIIGIPTDDKYNYEFMAVRSLPSGDFQWLANFEDGWLAEKYALANDGAVVHNVRITHKELKSDYKE